MQKEKNGKSGLDLLAAGWGRDFRPNKQKNKENSGSRGEKGQGKVYTAGEETALLEKELVSLPAQRRDCKPKFFLVYHGRKAGLKVAPGRESLTEQSSRPGRGRSFSRLKRRRYPHRW